MIQRLACVLVSFALVAGCSNKLGGELDLDGKKIAFDSCRSGQVYGFAGVELRATNGKAVRLVSLPDGTAYVLVGGPELPRFDEVGVCGPLTLNSQSTAINDVTNVEGSATLDCSANGHTVKGEVSWENCH